MFYRNFRETFVKTLENLVYTLVGGSGGGPTPEAREFVKTAEKPMETVRALRPLQ